MCCAAQGRRQELPFFTLASLLVKQSLSPREAAERIKCGKVQCTNPWKTEQSHHRSVYCRLIGSAEGSFRRLGVNPAVPAFEHLDTLVREELEKESSQSF